MNQQSAARADTVFMVTSVADIDCGGGNHVFNLTTGLRQRGCNVHAICFEVGSLLDGLKDAGVPTRLCPIRRKSDVRGWVDLRQLFLTERPYIVHSHGERATFMASWAARSACIPAIIATIHRSVPHTETWSWPYRRLYTLVEDWTLRMATTGAVAVSESLRSVLIQQRAHRPDRIVAIPNGTQLLSPGSIAAYREQATELRRNLGLAEDAYVIGTVGRVAKEKGFQYAIEAMKTVLKYVPGARLVIVGDGPHRDALAAYAEALRLGSFVRFVGHQTDVNRWLALFDLFVLPTPWEAFGLVLLEAMRFSIPVIAASSAGPAEIIQHQRSGILVPPGDSVALARAIVELSQDPERAQRIGISGYQKVRRCYSIDMMVDATVAFYSEQRARFRSSSARCST